jgi:hypothetical protein
MSLVHRPHRRSASCHWIYSPRGPRTPHSTVPGGRRPLLSFQSYPLHRWCSVPTVGSAPASASHRWIQSLSRTPPSSTPMLHHLGDRLLPIFLAPGATPLTPQVPDSHCQTCARAGLPSYLILCAAGSAPTPASHSRPLLSLVFGATAKELRVGDKGAACVVVVRWGDMVVAAWRWARRLAGGISKIIGRVSNSTHDNSLRVCEYRCRVGFLSVFSLSPRVSSTRQLHGFP